MQAFRDEIKGDIADVARRLDRVETRLGRVETRLDGVETRLDEMSNRMTRLETLSENATLGRDDALLEVPRRHDGVVPSAASPTPLDYPRTLAELVVAGNERLPNGTDNPWNRHKSRDLLAFYDGDMSDAESEPTAASRAAHWHHTRSTQLRAAVTVVRWAGWHRIT